MSTGSNPVPLTAGKPTKPIDIFGFIERYAFSIVVCALFIFTMIAPLALLAERPTYSVASKLKIDPVIPSLITKSEDPSIINYFHDYARTQVQRMQDDTVMEAAINRMTPEQQNAFFPKFLDHQGRINMLRGRIQIKPISRTHLLQLSMTSGAQVGLAEALNSVMDAFLAKVRNEHEKKYQSRLDFLREKKEDLKQEIVELKHQIDQLAQSVHTSSFVEDYNLVQKKVQQLQKITIQLMSERVRQESLYEATIKKGEELATLSLAPMIDEMVLSDQGLDFTTSWTYKKLQDMRASIDGITEQNKDRESVEQRMAAMREYEAKLRNEVRKSAQEILTGKRKYQLDTELIQSKAKYMAAKEAEKKIQSELGKNQVLADTISLGILKGSSLQKNLIYKQNFLFRLDTRIYELEAESKAPSRITIESRAQFPKNPSGSNLQKLLMGCIVLSIGAPGVCFLLVELLDNRIHRPKDVEFAVGSPPLWPISKSPPGVDFLRVLTDAPDHPASKALRSLAVHLNKEREEHQAKIFLFNGVSRGVGACSIMINTAFAMKNLVPRVLVVDCDLKDNHFVQLLKSPEEKFGLGEFLSGQKPLEDCLYRDLERHLDIIASGKPINASQATSRNLQAMLAEVRDMYDAIFLHSDPILTSDLTEYLSEHSDVTVLVSQGDKTLYRDLYRAASFFFRLEIPALAPLLNWGGQKDKDVITIQLEKLQKAFYQFSEKRRKKAATSTKGEEQA